MNTVAVVAAVTLVVGRASAQTPILPAGEDLSLNNRDTLLAELNSARSNHGACHSFEWDDSLATDMKSQVVKGSSCRDVSDVLPGTNGYEAFIPTFSDPTLTVSPKLAVDEWYGSASGMSFQNIVWLSHSKVGCAKCRSGKEGEGHTTWLFCKFTDAGGNNRQGAEADNVLPAMSACDLCTGVSCTSSQCETVSCDPSTGSCTIRTPAADGTSCDDFTPDTTNDVCTAGVCKGTDLCASKDCSLESTQCVDKYCEPATGECTEERPRPVGAPCDDKDPATVLDSCDGKICVGVNKCDGKVCTSTSPCEQPVGTCNRRTGECEFKTSDATSCINGGGEPGTCQAGKCVVTRFPVIKVDSPAGLQVHEGKPSGGTAATAADGTTYGPLPGRVGGDVRAYPDITALRQHQTLRFSCPDSLPDGYECEFYAVLYGCVLCPSGMDIRIATLMTDGGWTAAGGAGCRKSFLTDRNGVRQPAAVFRLVVARGTIKQQEPFPRHGFGGWPQQYIASYFSTTLPSCASATSEPACASLGDVCSWTGTSCERLWCPKRSWTGPSNERDGGSPTLPCSATCIA